MKYKRYTYVKENYTFFAINSSKHTKNSTAGPLLVILGILNFNNFCDYCPMGLKFETVKPKSNIQCKTLKPLWIKRNIFLLKLFINYASFIANYKIQIANTHTHTHPLIYALALGRSRNGSSSSHKATPMKPISWRNANDAAKSRQGRTESGRSGERRVGVCGSNADSFELPAKWNIWSWRCRCLWRPFRFARLTCVHGRWLRVAN